MNWETINMVRINTGTIRNETELGVLCVTSYNNFRYMKKFYRLIIGYEYCILYLKYMQ
jgi:hypothetical protein